MAVDATQLTPGTLVLVKHPQTGKPFTAKVETVYADMVSLLPDWWGFKYAQLFWLANVVEVLGPNPQQQQAGDDTDEPARLRLPLTPTSLRRTA